MIKLDSIYKSLEKVKNTIEAYIDTIEDLALLGRRDLTAEEEERISDAQEEIMDIDLALGSLVYYCDDVDFPCDIGCPDDEVFPNYEDFPDDENFFEDEDDEEIFTTWQDKYD